MEKDQNRDGIIQSVKQALVVGPDQKGNELKAMLEAFPGLETLHVLTPSTGEEEPAFGQGSVVKELAEYMRQHPEIKTKVKFYQGTVMLLPDEFKNQMDVVLIRSVLAGRSFFTSKDILHAYQELAGSLSPAGYLIAGSVDHTRPDDPSLEWNENPFEAVAALPMLTMLYRFKKDSRLRSETRMNELPKKPDFEKIAGGLDISGIIQQETEYGRLLRELNPAKFAPEELMAVFGHIRTYSFRAPSLYDQILGYLKSSRNKNAGKPLSVLLLGPGHAQLADQSEYSPQTFEVAAALSSAQRPVELTLIDHDPFVLRAALNAAHFGIANQISERDFLGNYQTGLVLARDFPKWVTDKLPAWGEYRELLASLLQGVSAEQLLQSFQNEDKFIFPVDLKKFRSKIKLDAFLGDLSQINYGTGEPDLDILISTSAFSYGFVTSLMAGKNSDKEKIVQDNLILLYRVLSRLKVGGDAWITGINNLYDEPLMNSKDLPLLLPRLKNDLAALGLITDIRYDNENGAQLFEIRILERTARSEARKQSREIASGTAYPRNDNAILEISVKLTNRILASDMTDIGKFYALLFPGVFAPKEPMSKEERAKLASAYVQLLPRGAAVVIPAKLLLGLSDQAKEEYLSILYEGVKGSEDRSLAQIIFAGEEAMELKEKMSSILKQYPQLFQVVKINPLDEVTAARNEKKHPVSVSFTEAGDHRAMDSRIPSLLLPSDEIKKLSESQRFEYLNRLTQLQLLAAQELKEPLKGELLEIALIRFLRKLNIEFDTKNGFLSPSTGSLLAADLTQAIAATKLTARAA